jgi:hypothetical protein
MPETQGFCLYCERTSDEVPLVTILYRGSHVFICPEHLPILIHKPAQLADKLPGVERLGGHRHESE